MSMADMVFSWVAQFHTQAISRCEAVRRVSRSPKQALMLLLTATDYPPMLRQALSLTDWLPILTSFENSKMGMIPHFMGKESEAKRQQISVGTLSYNLWWAQIKY